ncbi:MAG: ABC transporter ATP-binding protein, partial [Stenotrophomonas sp.]
MSTMEDANIDSTNLAIRVRGLVNRFGSQTVHDGLDLDVRR